jgi:hypothetical protein
VTLKSQDAYNRIIRLSKHVDHNFIELGRLLRELKARDKELFKQVFRNEKEGARIAIVLNANLYDLSGNLVGRLDDQNTIDVRTWSMPIALLQGADPRATRNPLTAFVTLTGGRR